MRRVLQRAGGWRTADSAMAAPRGRRELGFGGGPGPDRRPSPRRAPFLLPLFLAACAAAPREPAGTTTITVLTHWGAGYQEKTHARLNAALARGQVFVGFLTTYPRLSINHSVLIYKQKSFSPNPGVERYFVYDPNHPESPRELTWSPHTRSFSYQKDWDFIGGSVRVYQVYGKWLQ